MRTHTTLGIGRSNMEKAVIPFDHAAKFGFLLLALVVVFFLPSRCQAQNIEGTYNLYSADDSSGKVVGTMTIYNQSGSSFSIGGSGWSGTGRISGSSGYYDWKFTNGGTGRTTISARSDGTLEGHVRGTGPGGRPLDWSYIAKPTSRPQPAASRCYKVSDPIKDNETNQYYIVIDNACAYAIQVNARNGGVDYGKHVGSGEKGQKLTITPIGGKVEQDYKVTVARAPGS